MKWPIVVAAMVIVAVAGIIAGIIGKVQLHDASDISNSGAVESPSGQSLSGQASLISVELAGRFHLALLEFASEHNIGVVYLGPLAYKGVGNVLLDSGRGVLWTLEWTADEVNGAVGREPTYCIIAISSERGTEQDCVVEMGAKSFYVQYAQGDFTAGFRSLVPGESVLTLGDLLSQFAMFVKEWERALYGEL